jgi:uncharacterized protein (DUF2384 family)
MATRKAPVRAAAPAAKPVAGAVLAKATIRSADLLGLSGAALGKILGLSEATVSRIHNGERPIEPQSKEGELASLLIRLYRSLDALVGNDEKRRRDWLSAYNRAFNGVPRDMVQTAQGLVLVVAYLDGMRATV